jgi:two-component sensor histidine kinase
MGYSMSSLEYHETPQLSRDQVEEALRSTDEEAISMALLSAALYEPDAEWVQAQCMRLLRPPYSLCTATAIVSLGHLARIHGTLDTDRVIPALEECRRDTKLAGFVSDALDDIQMYVREKEK